MTGSIRAGLRRLVASFELRPNTAVAVALGVICLPLALLTLWTVGSGSSGSPITGTFGAGAVVVVALLAACVVAVATNGLELDRRRSWQLCVAGLGIYALGAVVWFATLHGALAPSSTGLGDLLYVVAMLAFLAAALRHPLLRPRSRLVRACIDAAIVAASASVWLWLAVGRHLLASTGDRLGTAACLLFPALDAFLVVLCLTATARPRIEHRSVASGMLLSGGFALLFVGDVAQAFIRTYGDGDGFPPLVEAAWVCCFVLLAASAWVARGTSNVTKPTAARQRTATLVAALPASCAVIATIVTVTDASKRGVVDATAVVMLMSVVALALVRQSLTVADNMRLGDSLQSAVDELEDQATHDTLTRLPNRAGLMGRIDDVLARGERDGSLSALLFLDLDHLKAVNDSLGHHAGDDLLRTVSSRLVARVGSGVTRFGGDEFVVLLERLSSPSAAVQLGRAIVGDASTPMTVQGYLFRPSVSVGVALTEPGITSEELLRRADVALYRAKSLGRRCVAEYEPSLDVAARRQVDLEPELRRALERDEFEVHYQPVVSLTTGEVVGVESLLRWRHPERGLLPPAEFLDEAAAKGMLAELGRRTLLQVCADFGGAGHRRLIPLNAAVNLSTSELVDERVVDRVADALALGRMPASRLTIEITEDVIVDDTIRRTIDRLRSLGVDLSIDDFGTGNSSLRQLGAYPASTLKVDRSFVERFEEDPRAEAITRAILGLARNLGLRTVAEGVETEAQARMLARHGCDFAQGWHYARAMPLDELVEFLESYPASRQPDSGQPDSRASVASASEMIEASSSATGGRSSMTPTT